MTIINSGTQFPLKMLSDSILYCSNFKIFHFQHIIILTCTYSVLCNCERGASCTWLPVPTQTFPLAKYSTSESESHTYNLKAVYKISTGRKYYEFYVEMSPNCSILASIFQRFPGGHAPRPPQFQHAKHAGRCALHTSTQEISTLS